MRIGPAAAYLPSKKIPGPVSLFLALSLIVLSDSGLGHGSSDFDPVGLWYARLSPTESNPVEFQVRITKKGNVLAASLINGRVSEPFSGVAWDGTTLSLEMAHYDARIVATPKDGNLEGMFTRIIAAGTREFPFSATRTAPPPVAVKKPGISVSGTWAVEIARPGGSPENVTALLSQKGTAVTGTMATASGDYGPLHGTFDGEQLVLTVFNGIFVYRFTAELLPDGSLAGEYRASKVPPVDWKGKKQPVVPEFAGPKPREPASPFVFVLPEMDGRTLSSTEAPFAERAMIVTAMGSWCPNCHDEAPLLEELWKRYGAQGLEVVAFTYEYTDDLERSRRLVAQFRKRNSVSYPILWAGTTKDAAASPFFSRLDGPRAYPTTLFLDRQHRIVGVHAGFDGPATGERFTKLRKEWEKTVRKLVGAADGFPVPGATSLGIR